MFVRLGRLEGQFRKIRRSIWVGSSLPKPYRKCAYALSPSPPRPLPPPTPPLPPPVFMRIMYIRNCFCSRSLIFNLAASINQPTRTPAVSHQQAVNTACNASKQTARQQTASSQPANRLQPYATHSLL